MNNKFYEIPTDWYNEFNNTFMNQMNSMPNMPNMNNMPNMMMNNTTSESNDLADPKTAFLRGNLFNSLYDPYKNYKYRELRPKNEKEELLYNILKHHFVLTELDLYLDVYPFDRNMVNTYNKILNDKKSLCDMYEQKFGPLTLEGLNMGDNDWNWVKGPWPWEGMK